MKAVMISIKPEWVEKILNGKKTIEIRKTTPKCELPCKVYIYCTKSKTTALNNHNGNVFLSPAKWQDYSEVNGKVVGEFTLNYWAKFRLYPENKIVQWREESDWTRFFEKDSERRSIKAGCVPFDQLNKYLNGKDGYALYIDDLKKYDQPKELSEFNLPECEKSENACENCKHLEVINTPYAYETNCVKPRKLTKAPQSWCYVEELEAK